MRSDLRVLEGGGGPHRPATDRVIRLLDRVVHCVAGRVAGHGCLLSCLPLVRRTAGVSVRMVRSLAVCWSMACGPLPVSSRTDGSQASCGAEMLGEVARVKPASLMEIGRA